MYRYDSIVRGTLMMSLGLQSFASFRGKLSSLALAVMLAASSAAAVGSEYVMVGTYTQQTFDGYYGQSYWWDLPMGWRSDTSIPSPRYDYANPTATEQSTPTGPNALTATSRGGTYISRPAIHS